MWIIFLALISFKFSNSSFFQNPPNSVDGTFFHDIPLHKSDPILDLQKEYVKDTNPKKVNLGIGSYRDDYGRPYVFPTVRKVQSLMLDPEFLSENYFKKFNISEEDIPMDGLFGEEYLPSLGFNVFYENVCKLIFNDAQNNECTGSNSKILSFHMTSSTAAIGAILKFFNDFVEFENIALSTPTWSEYESLIHSKCPGKHVLYYRYAKKNETTNCTFFDFQGMMEDLRKLPERTVVMLQSGCHNPTGIDPTIEQWKEIAKIFREKDLFPFIDAAYLGFLSGDFSSDSEVIRLFKNIGIEMAVSVSFSKNLGLYGERVGTGHIVVNDKSLLKNISSQIEATIGEIYASPPAGGSRIAYFVMNVFYDKWKKELEEVVLRVKNMRFTFVKKLKELGAPIDFSYMLNENGLFTVLPFNKDEIIYMKKKYHIYVIQNGRLNIAGLTNDNIDYVTSCIYEMLKK